MPFVDLFNNHSDTPESKYFALINHIGLPSDEFPNSSLSLIENICDEVAPVKLAEVAGAVSTIAFSTGQEDEFTGNYHALWYLTFILATHIGKDASLLIGYYLGELTAKHVARKDLPNFLFEELGHVLPVFQDDPRFIFLAGVCEGLGDTRLRRALSLES